MMTEGVGEALSLADALGVFYRARVESVRPVYFGRVKRRR